MVRTRLLLLSKWLLVELNRAQPPKPGNAFCFGPCCLFLVYFILNAVLFAWFALAIWAFHCKVRVGGGWVKPETLPRYRLLNRDRHLSWSEDRHSDLVEKEEQFRVDYAGVIDDDGEIITDV